MLGTSLVTEEMWLGALLNTWLFPVGYRSVFWPYICMGICLFSGMLELSPWATGGAGICLPEKVYGLVIFKVPYRECCGV